MCKDGTGGYNDLEDSDDNSIADYDEDTGGYDDIDED